MPILTVRHITTYHYKHPVAFGEHRIMLRPRDDGDQMVLDAEIIISPEPSELTWTQDHLGNHIAIARFAEKASALCVESTIRVEHLPVGFHATNIEGFARTHPFSYGQDGRVELARFIAPLSSHSELVSWATRFLREDGSADTHELTCGND